MYNSHMVAAHGHPSVEVSCPICGQKFTRQGALVLHLQKMHTEYYRGKVEEEETNIMAS